MISAIGLWIEGKAHWQSEDQSCFSKEFISAYLVAKDEDAVLIDCVPMHFREEMVD